VPREGGLLELNFIGMDAAQDPAEAYIVDDDHDARPGMPDPRPRRDGVAALLRLLERDPRVPRVRGSR
jgi:hypothetical protein